MIEERMKLIPATGHQVIFYDTIVIAAEISFTGDI